MQIRIHLQISICITNQKIKHWIDIIYIFMGVIYVQMREII